MIAKKYISALIILLTLLGFYKEQTPAQNQEIELQFANAITQPLQAEEIIQAIKSKLETLDVKNITVRQQSNQTLKIAYHSQQEVAAIKALLVDAGFESEFPLQELPFKNASNTLLIDEFATTDGYKIDVYELQTASDSYIGMQGKFILSLQKEYDKSPSPNSFALYDSYIAKINGYVKISTHTVSHYKAIYKDATSYETPDVRAGPISLA